jgi:hypothetical protein
MSDPQLEIIQIQSINAPAGETVLAIVRSRPQGNVICEAGYIQISIGRRLWAGLIISSLVLVHLILWMVIFNNENNLSETIVIGIALGQSQLLGLWLGISPWALWKRLPVVAAISGLGAWFPGGDKQLVVIAWSFVSVAALVFSIPRIVFGWRMDFQPEQPNSLPSWRSGGTILGIMGYVFVCGLFLAIIQYVARSFLGSPNGNDWLEFLSVTMPMTLLNASCTTAVMCPASRAGKAVAVGVIAAFAAVALAIQFAGTAGEYLQMVVYCSLASLTVYGFSIFLLRKLGWRLYQQTPPQAKLPEANVSFDAL